jgi:hypothetical protein
MTSIAVSRNPAGRAGRTTQLAIAMLIGAVAGSAGTFLAAGRAESTAVGPAPATVAITDASRQYSDWYLRAAIDAQNSSSSRQYVEWYTRSSSLAGTTTAGEQYRDWYARP